MKKVLLTCIVASLSVAACSKPAAPSPALDSNPGAAGQNDLSKLPPAERLDKAIEIGFETVYFEFDSYVLTDEARAHLKQLADAMKVNPGVRIQIEGHSDERGSNEYNLALGQKRAQAIKEFLVNEGISNDALTTASAGEEKPAESGSNESAWAKNRRGVFTKLN